VVDRVAELDIRSSRETDAREIEVKRKICVDLGLNSAALVNEGFVVYSPEPPVLLRALSTAVHSGGSVTSEPNWQFISNSAKTINGLSQSGAIGRAINTGDQMPFLYIGL